MILAPLPGNPDAIRRLADRLTSSGRRTAAITGVLAKLRDGATWEGCAGEALGGRLRELPPVLDAVAARLGGAAGPLRTLAEVMEESQRVIAVAIRGDIEAQETYVALEDRAYVLQCAGVSEGSPDVAVVRHLQREQLEVQAAAQSRYAAAIERFHAADRQCSAALRALSADALADSGLYRLAAGASTFGRDMSTLGVATLAIPELAPVVAVAGAVGVVADTALLVAYDEGSWSELGTSAALAATGGAGGVLKAAGKVGARRTAAGVVVTRQLTAQQRLAVGAAAHARDRRAAIRARFTLPPERGTARALLGGPTPRPVRGPLVQISREQVARRLSDLARTGATRAQTAARARADRAFLDGWRLASANGPQAQRMYTAGVTLEVGTKVAAKEMGGAN